MHSLLDSVQFDTEGWTLAKRRDNSVEWRNADGDTLRTSIDSNLPAVLSAPSGIGSLRSFYREEAIRRGGGIVCVEIVQAGGVRALKVINKYERPPAYGYDGTLMVPFRNAQLNVTIDSTERGATGERDAIVHFHLAEQGELEIEPLAAPGEHGEMGRIKGWCQDPYDPGWQGSAIYSVSDDDRLDVLFPNHPLSKIRKYLGRVEATLIINQPILSDNLLQPGSIEKEGFSQPRHLLSSPTLSSLYVECGKTVGSSLLQTGRLDDAEKLLEVSVSELERTVGADDPMVAEHLLLLGTAHYGRERYLDGESAFSRARSIFEQSLGPNDLDTARAVLHLAWVYLPLARHDEAEPLFQHALKVFNEKDASGSNSGVALNGLGLVRNARGLYLDAIPFFEEALKIFERVHGPDCIDCARVLLNLAVSLQHTGDNRRAERALNRARRIHGM
jgi:tetratricopeptide (TPR) repeat protein